MPDIAVVPGYVEQFGQMRFIGISLAIVRL